MFGEFIVNNSSRFLTVMFALDFLSQLYHFIDWKKITVCKNRTGQLNKQLFQRHGIVESTLKQLYGSVSLSFSPAAFLKRQFHPNWGHGPNRFPRHPRRPWHRAAPRRRLHGRALLPRAVAHGLGGPATDFVER